jgi:RNA polymerase sigma-70 factor (ECF subfamily)
MSAGSSSREAWKQYVLPELEVLLRVARSLTPSTADAEDLVQDTLLRAFRGIDSFDGRHPRAWLLTIMRNANINRTRRQRPALLRDPDAALERLDATQRRDQAEMFVDAGFDDEVESALAALSEDFRLCVELVDIGGLSYGEASEALGVPVGTVMSRLHRARKRIRDRLDRAGYVRRRA